MAENLVSWRMILCPKSRQSKGVRPSQKLGYEHCMRHSCWPDPPPMLYCSYVLALLRISLLVKVWVTKLRVLSAFLHSFDHPFDVFFIVSSHCFKVVGMFLIIRESIDDSMKLCDSVLASTDWFPLYILSRNLHKASLAAIWKLGKVLSQKS